VGIDDHSRVGFAVQALQAAVAHYKALGVTVRRLLTDTAAPTDLGCLQRPARRWASSTPSPGPTGRRPTARQNGSSRLACVNGPTGAPGATAQNALTGCPRSWPTTTPEGLTRPWATSLQLPAVGGKNLLQLDSSKARVCTFSAARGAMPGVRDKGRGALEAGRRRRRQPAHGVAPAGRQGSLQPPGLRLRRHPWEER
jgi:hypothetical protein